MLDGEDKIYVFQDPHSLILDNNIMSNMVCSIGCSWESLMDLDSNLHSED